MTRKTSDWERTKAQEIAAAILAERIEILEGVQQLFPFAHSEAILLESDRTLIIAIYSEIDGLPIGNVREHWLPESLREKDVVIERCRTQWRDQVLAACERIVSVKR